MVYGVALGLTVLPYHDSWAGFIVSRNSVGKLRASDLLQFVDYSDSLMIGWLGARELARNPGHAPRDAARNH